MKGKRGWRRLAYSLKRSVIFANYLTTNPLVRSTDLQNLPRGVGG